MEKLKIFYYSDGVIENRDEIQELISNSCSISFFNNRDLLAKECKKNTDLNLLVFKTKDNCFEKLSEFFSGLKQKNDCSKLITFAILNKITETEKNIATKFNINELFLDPLSTVLFQRYVEDIKLKHTQQNVLVIDDNEDERIIIKHLLKDNGLNALEAENGKDAKIYLYRDDISLVILDIYMPIMNGYETCKMLKQRESFKHVPIIAVTSSERGNDLKKMLDAGANDFLRKPFLFEEFSARIKAHLRTKNYFDEVQSKVGEEEKLNMRLVEVNERINDLNKKLEDMAITDYLTKIYNRRYSIEYLEKEIQRCERYNTTFSIIMFDIDYFKKVNDTYGHLAGDEILKKFTEIILNNTRKSDILGRFGGEEFLLILPNAKLKQAMTLGEKLRQAIQEKVFKIKNNEINITISQGVAQYKKNDITESVIRRADEALFKAKSSGRNKVMK